MRGQLGVESTTDAPRLEVLLILGVRVRRNEDLEALLFSRVEQFCRFSDLHNRARRQWSRRGAAALPEERHHGNASTTEYPGAADALRIALHR